MKKKLFLLPITLITPTPIVSMVCCASLEDAVVDFSIKTQPTKTAFFVDDEFTSIGMVLTVTHESGKTSDVTSGWTTDYDGKTFTQSDIGEGKSVTVTYKNITATYEINVKNAEVKQINVTTLPTKTEYFVDDFLDLSGLVVTATLENDKTRILTTDEYTTNPNTTTPLTTQTESITVTYVQPTTNEPITTTFNIDVRNPKVKQINVTTPPTKTEYFDGEFLDLSGLVVTATLENDKTRVLTADEYTTNPDITTPLTTEMESVTITYVQPTTNEPITTSFDIDVVEEAKFKAEVGQMSTTTKGAFTINWTDGHELSFNDDWAFSTTIGGNVTSIDVTGTNTKTVSFVLGSDLTTDIEDGKLEFTYDDITTGRTNIHATIENIIIPKDYLILRLEDTRTFSANFALKDEEITEDNFRIVRTDDGLDAQIKFTYKSNRDLFDQKLADVKVSFIDKTGNVTWTDSGSALKIDAIKPYTRHEINLGIQLVGHFSIKSDTAINVPMDIEVLDKWGRTIFSGDDFVEFRYNPQPTK